MKVDKSGKLDFQEFKVMWDHVDVYRIAMAAFDADKSGTLNTIELVSMPVLEASTRLSRF
jgi:hypothetical protein